MTTANEHKEVKVWAHRACTCKKTEYGNMTIKNRRMFRCKWKRKEEIVQAVINRNKWRYKIRVSEDKKGTFDPQNLVLSRQSGSIPAHLPDGWNCSVYRTIQFLHSFFDFQIFDWIKSNSSFSSRYIKKSVDNTATTVLIMCTIIHFQPNEQQKKR